MPDTESVPWGTVLKPDTAADPATLVYVRQLTGTVVAEAHVVEGDVVLADGGGGVPVVLERLLVLPDAVVEPTDLERDVLVLRMKRV
jgi:hypothetical protein